MHKKTEKTEMALKEYYKKLSDMPTPQQELRDRLSRECLVSEKTVYSWLSGKATPHKGKQAIISEIIGIPIEQLFPTKKIE
jgi:hypothetical protein